MRHGIVVAFRLGNSTATNGGSLSNREPKEQPLVFFLKDRG